MSRSLVAPSLPLDDQVVLQPPADLGDGRERDATAATAEFLECVLDGVELGPSEEQPGDHRAAPPVDVLDDAFCAERVGLAGPPDVPLAWHDDHAVAAEIDAAGGPCLEVVERPLIQEGDDHERE